MELSTDFVRVASDNMFQSTVFREAFINTADTIVELFDTSGALCVAIGAGIGVGVFKSCDEAFGNLEKVETLHPDPEKKNAYRQVY